MGAVLEEMMECLALEETSTFYQDYYDPAYEFDACKFFDFCADETDYEVREAGRWFRYAREDPPAPYMMKINLTNILKSIPANVLTTSSSKLEADHGHVGSTASGITSSDRSVLSLEEKTEEEGSNENANYLRKHENGRSRNSKKFDADDFSRDLKSPGKSRTLLSENDGRMQWRFRDVQLLTEYLIRRDELSAGSGLKYHNPTADDHIVKAKLKSGNKSSKPSRTFMKPTASHLAKQINMVDVHANSYGRSNKLETPTRCQNEDTKKQKLENGFLRKAAQLKHQTSFPHKMTTKADQHLEISSNSRSKTTIPRKPKLMTEERAQRRRFRSQSKPEANVYTLPLNRKILESPPLSMLKKNMPQYSPLFQKSQVKTSGMQHQSR